MTLSWGSVSGAGAYSVGLRDLNTNYLYPIPLVTGTSTTQSITQGHSYRWDVASCTSYGGGDNTTNCPNRSGDWYFSAAAAAPPAPTQIAPANGSVINGTSVTLSWSSVSGAGAYSVGLRDINTNYLYPIPLQTGTSTTQSLTAGHSYKWDVASCSSSGGGDNTTNCPNRSGDWYFSAAAAAPPAPTQIAPANGSVLNGTSVTLSWSSVSGAGAYSVGLRDLNTDYLYPIPLQGGTSTTQTVTPGHSYRWDVASCSSSGGGDNTTNCPNRSGDWYFSVAAAAPPAPTQIAPANGSVLNGTSVTLSWSSVSGAGAYSVGLRDLNTDYLYPIPLQGGTSTTQTVTPGHSYRWDVASCSSSGGGDNTTNCPNRSGDWYFSMQSAPPGSDLTPQNIVVPGTVEAGTAFTPTWSLANIGSGQANATSKTTVQINQSLSAPSGTKLTYIDTAALAGNSGVGQQATITAPVTPGTYYVWITADYYKSVTNDTDPSDNAKPTAFSVGSTGLSDLTPQNIQVPPSVAPGAQFIPTWSLANIGTAAANAKSKTTVQINQSSAGPSGTRLAYVDTAALAGNTAAGQNAAISAPSAPGNYYLWIDADYNHAVTNQSTQSNDAIAVGFVVQDTSYVVNERVMAASTGACVRPTDQYGNIAQGYCRDVGWTQVGGVHGTIVAGPKFANAGGYNGAWWQVAWDSQPWGLPSLGWTAGSSDILQPAPLGGDIARPSFSNNPYYTTSKAIRNAFFPKYAPPSVCAGTTCGLLESQGNCTWYTYGRMLELGYNKSQLDAIAVGGAIQWAQNAQSVAGVTVDLTPSVGAIAQLDTGAGHVAVIESVNGDGTITVTESAYIKNNPPYDPWNILWRHRSVVPTWFKHFIHLSRTAERIASIPDYSSAALRRPDTANEKSGQSESVSRPGATPTVAHWLWPIEHSDDRSTTIRSFAMSKSENSYKTRGLYHTGLDIAAPAGTAVVASADGSVVGVTKSTGRDDGEAVVIAHAGGIYSRYDHLGRLDPDLEGEIERSCPAQHGASHLCAPGVIGVHAGQRIGYVGDDARGSTDGDADHLHFQIQDFEGESASHGYAGVFPESLGFIDPSRYLDGATGVQGSPGVIVTAAGQGQFLRLGPRNDYPAALVAKAGDAFSVRQSAPATADCSDGWYQVFRGAEHPPATMNFFVSTLLQSKRRLPDAWMCRGNGGAHWLTP